MSLSRRAGLVVSTGTIVLALPCAFVGVAASHARDERRAGTIAFLRAPAGFPVADYSTGPSLYVIHADGSGLRRLTPRGVPVHAYAWSPDGRLIAYIDSRRFSLWLVRSDGMGRRLLLGSSELRSVGLSWSPDGKDIAIVSPGADADHRTAQCGWKMTLYVVPVDGATPARLPGGRHVGWAATSPGRRGKTRLPTTTAKSGSSARTGPAVGRSRPSAAEGWSADGEQLAFGVVIHPRNGFTNRYRASAAVNVDGTGFHVVTRYACDEYGRVWSPSGRRILYGRADRKGIYVIGADGRNNHRVTRDSPPQAGWGALAWSPNGGSIVYTTGGTDNTDLHLIGIDGRGKVQLTSTSDVDIAPSWVAR